jgi:hypothetical protein
VKRLVKPKRAPGEDTIDVEAFHARRTERLGGLGELVHAVSNNSAWIVRDGEQYVGRVLAKGEVAARELAVEFWGDRTYQLEQVKR